MVREVPFGQKHVCDECGAEGAYDFMGDYLCQDCVNLLIPPEND